MAVVLVVASAPPSARADGPPLTLEQAIQLALSRNERAEIAGLEIAAAEAGVARARVAFLPLVTLGASAVLRPRNDPAAVAQSQLALNQPLLNPPARPLLDQAKHALAAQRARSTEDRRRLAFDTANAYMAVLLAEQVLQAAQRKLETATTNLAQTDAQVKAQLVSSNDVTRAQINLATAEREVAARRGNIQEAYVDLAFVLNTRVAGGLAPPTTLLEAGQQARPIAEELVGASLARRPDLAAFRQQALAAHDFAREPRMRYYPQVGLNAQIGTTTNAPGTSAAIDGQVGLTATWIVFDSGGRANDARIRDARARVADLEAQALARSIEADVRAAIVQLAASQQALAAARDARDAARRSATEAEILYRQGLAKAIELIDANDQRFNAEVNYATSEFNVATAYLALRRATGLDPLEGTP